jgi:2-phospho-L-lactate guanylyltransferase
VVVSARSTWCAVVPQKALARAKGRLKLAPGDRRRLAVAMLRDTVDALAATPGMVQTFVLWDDHKDIHVLSASGTVRHVVTEGHNLNESLEIGVALARQVVPGCHVVVVPSDLPALQPTELTAFLARAVIHPRSFLADSTSVGTSMLTVTGEAPLLPAYGPHSRSLHVASGAHELSSDDLSTLRHDVDDLAGLGAATALGCGAHTIAALFEIRAGVKGMDDAE